jgi:hypothetical protein
MAEQLAAKKIRGRQLNEKRKSVEAKQLALHRSSGADKKYLDMN